MRKTTWREYGDGIARSRRGVVVITGDSGQMDGKRSTAEREGKEVLTQWLNR